MRRLFAGGRRVLQKGRRGAYNGAFAGEPAMEWIVFFVVVAVLAVWLVNIYNALVKFKNRGENAFAQIDVQLKRRYDLIPNLTQTAKGYLKHERETLEAVIAARDKAKQLLGEFAANLNNAGAASALGAAEGALASALGGLQVAVEAYPDLKASANMAQLSEELASTENKIAFARQAYNDSVNEYNTYRQSFPPVLFAGAFGHAHDMSPLVFDEGEKLKEAPKVEF